MPYIKADEREAFEPVFQAFRDAVAGGMTPGHLNYAITRLVHTYLDVELGDGQWQPGWNYAMLNEVIGVLECAKLEFYRHIVGPYEDIKIRENGDVR